MRAEAETPTHLAGSRCNNPKTRQCHVLYLQVASFGFESEVLAGLVEREARRMARWVSGAELDPSHNPESNAE
jgi:hypothetical protein